MSQPTAAEARVVRLAAAGLLAFGCVLVLQPFITAALLAAVACMAIWPLNLVARRAAMGSPTGGAALVTGGVAVLIVLPFALATTAIVDAAPAWIEALRAWIAEPEHPAPPWLTGIPLIGPSATAQWDQLATSRDEAVRLARQLLDPASGVVLGGGASVGKGLADLGIALVIGFFFLRDGERLAFAIRSLLRRVAGPFADSVLDTVRNTSQGVLLGIAGTAAAQSAVALAGFLIVGAPAPWLLGVSTGLLSLIPAGPPLIWLGVTTWLVNEGRLPAALFMGLYGMFAISGVDNIVRPILISRGMDLPFVLVVAGVFGGLLAFGFVGLFLGPVLLAVGYAALKQLDTD